MASPPGDGSSRARSPSLAAVATGWGRIGCVGFGGPPAHITLLRKLCVEDNRWISDRDFEDAIAACNLLPGPASTQLAIYCGWHVAGPLGAVVAGLAFILPGLTLILALSALFLATSPPTWVLGAGAGAGAAVAAVALRAGCDLVAPSRRGASSRWRWAIYALLGGTAAATVGPWIVAVLLICGVAEVVAAHGRSDLHTQTWPIVGAVTVAAATGGGLALAWVALKVGALSYGGGFVIIPLMQADAVQHYHWMTNSQFLDAVALGQVTPGPVVHTVAVVGYAAAGLVGGLFAAAVAFIPSFMFVLVGAAHFDRLRHDARVRAFLGGAGPAAIGAIIGVAIPLALALEHPWQFAVLGVAAIAILPLRRSTTTTLVTAGAIGVIASQLGMPVH